MYIKNRFNKNGDIISNINDYTPQYTTELTEFLNEIYFSENSFNQNDDK